MVVDWEQETGLLMSSGDVRIVRIWDTDREMKVQVTAAPPGLPTLLPPQTGPCPGEVRVGVVGLHAVRR